LQLTDAPADGARYLLALRAADRDSREWIRKLLTGIDASRRAPA
jgi:hypothetical protein